MTDQPYVPAVPARIQPRPQDWDRTVEFYTDTKGEVRYRVKARNGRLKQNPGEGYKNFSDAAKAVSEDYMLPLEDVKSGSPGIVRADGMVWRIVQGDG